MAGLKYGEQFTLRIVEKENGGVSAARNLGLDLINGDTHYISLLDSDDIWKPEMLQKGINALSQGYDFFFCDHARWGMYESHISEYCSSILKNPTFLDQNIHLISKGELIDHILDSFPTKASNSIYKWDIAKNIRFREDIKSAGEDILYFTELVSSSSKCCFSSEVLVECADGINMFYNSYRDWDSPKRLPITYDRVKTYDAISRMDIISEENRKNAMRLADLFRQDLIFFSLRFVWKHKKLPTEFLLLICNPKSMFWLPKAVIKLIIRRIYKEYEPA